jgi:hypothetical protein
MMSEGQLFLVSANKSRPSGEWSADDYDVREETPNGPLIGRIYELAVAPTGNWWFWAVQLFPPSQPTAARPATREAAMAAFKAQWIQRRGWEHPWIRRP